MKINFKNSFAFTLVLIFQFSIAQKKDPKKEENIGTEVVNVVKTFTPTISDAFKAKENPAIDEEENAKKESIKYTIFSFPVASTFTPSKGKAEGVEKEEQVHLFKNYATFGGGNYGVLNAELFVNQDLNSTDYVSGMIRHLSSQGGIKNVELSDKFYDTAVDLTYGSQQKALSWKLDLGYQNQIYNWYGLPSGFGSLWLPEEKTSLLNGINEQQSYNNLYLGTKITFHESVFKEASLKFNHFSDAFGSSENRFYVKPSLEFNISDKVIKTNVIVDYVGGSFEKNYSNTKAIKYGFTNFGIAPSFAMQEDDWTLNIGVGLFYSMDAENNDNKFLVYPQINASFKVVGDLMIFYAGAEGNLEQNSYMDFVNENPFLSPTLNIAPTDKQYDIYAGLKGKLADNISYNVRGSLVDENNKALFRSNDFSANFNYGPYSYGNSLQLVYDNVKTFRLFGELKADITEAISFSANGTLSAYTTKTQAEAWNLPAIKLNATLDYTINPKWYAGADVFFVGSRKDSQINNDLISIVAQTYIPTTLKSYIDLNAHVGYKHSERLTAFLKANNILNQAYQKWMNYPVQGFQVVLGANYKFDF